MKLEMSKKEARKVTIIEELLAGRFTNNQTAELLDLSVRQVQRMNPEVSTNGVMSILHKNRGRKPANTFAPEVAETICRTYQMLHAYEITKNSKDPFEVINDVKFYYD